jgi:hypothetical protein
LQAEDFEHFAKGTPIAVQVSTGSPPPLINPCGHTPAYERVAEG